MKNNLKVSKTIDLGPTEVAVVWNEKGDAHAYVADPSIANEMPPYVYLAFAMMLSRDDVEIMSRMWAKLEERMDAELAQQQDKSEGLILGG